MCILTTFFAFLLKKTNSLNKQKIVHATRVRTPSAVNQLNAMLGSETNKIRLAVLRTVRQTFTWSTVKVSRSCSKSMATYFGRLFRLCAFISFFFFHEIPNVNTKIQENVHQFSLWFGVAVTFCCFIWRLCDEQKIKVFYFFLFVVPIWSNNPRFSVPLNKSTQNKFDIKTIRWTRFIQDHWKVNAFKRLTIHTSTKDNLLFYGYIKKKFNAKSIRINKFRLEECRESHTNTFLLTNTIAHFKRTACKTNRIVLSLIKKRNLFKCFAWLFLIEFVFFLFC